MNQQTNTSNNPPVDSVQLGAIRCAIWANQHKDRVRYSVTMERRYRDENGDWQSTHSYGRDDLLRAGKALDLAETRILELEERDRQAARDAAAQVQQHAGNAR